MNPACGLLFIDWVTGDTLQLTGAAIISFDDTSLPGAQRSVTFSIKQWRYTPRGLPLAAPAIVIEPSPFNPSIPVAPSAKSASGRSKVVETVFRSSNSSDSSIGSPRESEAAEGSSSSSAVECVSVKDEARGVKTFEFKLPAAISKQQEELKVAAAAAAAGGLPYHPGQYATFDISVPDPATGKTAIHNRTCKLGVRDEGERSWCNAAGISGLDH